MVKTIFILVLSFLFISPLKADNDPRSAQGIAYKNQKEMEEMYRKDLEKLKDVNPELYRKLKDAAKQQEQVNKILEDYRTNRINLDYARQQLYPIFKKQMNDWIPNIDQQISALKKTINELEETKRNPEAVIQRNIDNFFKAQAAYK